MVIFKRYNIPFWVLPIITLLVVLIVLWIVTSSLAKKAAANLTTATQAALGKSLSSNQISNLYAIYVAFKLYGDGDKRKLAYIIATAYHESRLGDSGREIGQSSSGIYGNYYGRGLPQLTHEYNYRKYSSIVGRDLVANPDLVLDPAIGAKIMVYAMMNNGFTSTGGLGEYINSQKTDFINARNTVNGGLDRASLIAGYAQNILNYL